MSIQAAPVETTEIRTPPRPRTFRPDIQGLRAVAVVLVVLYHARVPGISGGFVGVDVFFVISGYLITGQLFRSVEKNGRVNLLDFYSRRIRRLLLPSAVVVLCSLAAARAVLPYSQVQSLLGDVAFVCFYGLNYRLAVEGVDYQQATAPPSALQHFWSLAVEEQFYVVWPLLIMAVCLLVARKWRRQALVIGLLGVLAVSLTLSIRVTGTNSPLAYFSLQTRAWELAVGALIALCAQRLAQLPARVAAVSGWIGLIAVLISAFVYDDTTPFPGTAALLPVLGAGVIIASGMQRVPHSVETTLLSHPVAQYIGKLSYSWYLWHWPMLILLPAWAGHQLSWGTNLEIVGLAFWAAVLTYMLEDFCHRSVFSRRRWLGIGIAVPSVLGLVVAGLTWTLPNLRGTGAARQATNLSSPDLAVVQAALEDGMKINALPKNLTPSLSAVQQDLPVSSADHCHALLQDVAPLTCTYGDRSATRTAVLVGDSHAQQWLGALIPAATRFHWKLVTYTKAACPVAAVSVWNNDLKRSYSECDSWRSRAYPLIKALQPDLLIASQSDSVPWTSVTDQAWAKATVTSLNDLAAAKTRVVMIGDTPQTDNDPVPCLQQHLDNAQHCAYQRSGAYQQFPDRHLVMGTMVRDAGFGFIDTEKFFCGNWCPAVVGNMLVRRDTGHITNTIAVWLSPMFDDVFKDGAA